MVVDMMYCQDIEDEAVDYIRNSGECVVGYVVGAIVDCLVVVYGHRGCRVLSLLF